MRDLDLIGIGMIMGEISPPRLGKKIGEAADHLVLLPSGSATIFMTTFARVGGKAAFISRVGNDDPGRWMVGELARIGFDTSAIEVVPGQLTPLALASVDDLGNKTFSFYRFGGACDPLSTLTPEDVADSLLERAAIFDLTEGSLRSAKLRSTSLSLAKRAKSLGCAVCVNPNYRAGSWAGGVDEARSVLREAITLGEIAIMNEEEAHLISGQNDAGAAMHWIADAGPSTVIVTSGSRTVLILDQREYYEVGIPPVNVVFDVGAGDAFHAGFLARWRPGRDAVACAHFAAATSALKISREPAIDNLPTGVEVEARLRSLGIEPVEPVA